MEAAKTELIALTEELLEIIRRADWDAYVALSDPALTCFEPEAKSRLEKGLAFHRPFFKTGGHLKGHTNRIRDPEVHLLGEGGAAVVYVREVERADPSGKIQKDCFLETRVWRRTDAGWRHVHFHRSVPEK